MAKIFLTGGTGFVGSFVVEELVRQKHEVICLTRKNSNLRWISGLPVTLHEASLFEPDSYKDVLKDVEYIFHIAGVTKALNIETYYRGNVDATREFIGTAQQVSKRLKRFLFVSSQAAVGPSDGEALLDEEARCQPLTDYGRSKMEAESVVKKHIGQLPLTIVRPPSVYGPRDTDVLNVFKNIKMGVNLQVGSVDQLVSLVYVEDLAQGIIQAAFAENTAGKTYFLCEDRPYRWSQFARTAGAVMKTKYLTIKIPYTLAYLVSGVIETAARIRKKPTILNRQKMLEVRQPYWGVSNLRARQDFDYQTRFPLEKGVRASIEWYRSAGWL